MEGSLGPVLKMYGGQFNNKASAQSAPSKSEQGYIQAHQHPGSTNNNTKSDREPNN